MRGAQLPPLLHTIEEVCSCCGDSPFDVTQVMFVEKGRGAWGGAVPLITVRGSRFWVVCGSRVLRRAWGFGSGLQFGH